MDWVINDAKLLLKLEYEELKIGSPGILDILWSKNILCMEERCDWSEVHGYLTEGFHFMPWLEKNRIII